MRKILKNISVVLAYLLLFIGLVSLFLFAFKPDAVKAMQDLLELANTLYRVDDEILGSPGFGKYYSDLYWNHNAELIRIYSSNPDKFQESIHLVNLYIDHLEALMDGRGDEVKISQEQVNELEDHLNWLASVSNPDLREDIEREKSRTPLQGFVGLSMAEALDFIEQAWQQDFPTTTPPTAPIKPTGTVITSPQ